MQQETVREAVGVFYDIHALNKAVAELETTAFPRHDISVLSSKSEIEDKYRTLPLDAAILEDDPDAPRTILIRPEEKTIGAAVLIGGGLYAGVVTALLASGNLPAVALAGLIVTGGFLGALAGTLVAWLLGHYYNGILQSQIRKNRMLLWVRTPGVARESLACQIMNKYGGRRVHIHEIS